eukprot:m.110491 g.110491  ORF g.110491 m.110491 type:complete len:240 (+) comp12887_c1_seq1:121-840(+)
MVSNAQGSGAANEIPCTVTNEAVSAIRCGEQTYSFETLRAPNGSSFFIADGPHVEYQYGLALIENSLPTAIKSCNISRPFPQSLAAIQGSYSLYPHDCYPIGSLADAVWVLDTSASPQVIRLNLTGMVSYQDMRSTSVNIVCDPEASAGIFKPLGEDVPLHYIYELRTSLACPPTGYVCRDSQCVPSDDGRGVTEKECLAICESGLFKCVDSICVSSPTGLPLGKCKDICERTPQFLQV